MRPASAVEELPPRGALSRREARGSAGAAGRGHGRARRSKSLCQQPAPLLCALRPERCQRRRRHRLGHRRVEQQQHADEERLAKRPRQQQGLHHRELFLLLLVGGRAVGRSGRAVASLAKKQVRPLDQTPVNAPSGEGPRCAEDVSALPPLLEPRAAIWWRLFLAAPRAHRRSSLRRRRNLSPPLPIGGRVSSARWRLALLPLLQSCRAAGGSSWPQRRLDARRQSRIDARACVIDPASQPGCGAPTGAGRACP